MTPEQLDDLEQRAKRAKLRPSNTAFVRVLHEELEDLIAQLRRYREALEWIAAQPSTGMAAMNTITPLTKRAKKALEQE